MLAKGRVRALDSDQRSRTHARPCAPIAHATACTPLSVPIVSLRAL
jgi:hypothetical protein